MTHTATACVAGTIYTAYTDKQTDRQADRQAGKQTDRQAVGQTGRQTDTQTGRREMCSRVHPPIVCEDILIDKLILAEHGCHFLLCFWYLQHMVDVSHSHKATKHMWQLYRSGRHKLDFGPKATVNARQLRQHMQHMQIQKLYLSICTVMLCGIT